MTYSWSDGTWPLSMPVGVQWAGWTSDTWTLQNAGWRLTARQSPWDYGIQLAMHHPEHRVYGQTEFVTMDRHRLTDMEYFRGRNLLTRIATDFVIHTHNYRSADNVFSRIDARPTFEKHENMSQWKLFSEWEPETEDMIVDPNSVPELMDRILELQVPAQKAIRHKRRRHARIISLEEE